MAKKEYKKPIHFVELVGQPGVYDTILNATAYAFSLFVFEPPEKVKQPITKPVYSRESRRETSLLTKMPPSIINKKI